MHIINLLKLIIKFCIFQQKCQGIKPTSALVKKSIIFGIIWNQIKNDKMEQFDKRLNNITKVFFYFCARKTILLTTTTGTMIMLQ